MESIALSASYFLQVASDYQMLDYSLVLQASSMLDRK